MTRHDDYAPRRLADRLAIQDLLYRWCRAVDRRDWAAIRDVFHPDAHDDHGIYKGDIDGLIGWLSERHATIVQSTHLLGNMLIEFSGADSAVVETYCFAVQRYATGGAATRSAITGGTDTGDKPFDMQMNGRYVDRIERRHGTWRIADRTTVFDNSILLPVPEAAPRLGADWPVGRRDGDDPVYRIRTAAGLA